MLKLLADPRKWFADVGRTAPEYTLTSSLSGLITDAYPELKNERALYGKVAKDLYNAGLIDTDGLHSMMSGSGAYAKRATKLGDQFLSFVSRPISSSQGGTP